MLLDFLFPKTCLGCGKWGSYFCETCILNLTLAAAICGMCGKRAIGGVTHDSCRRPLGMDGLVSIFSYQKAIQKAVKKLKYRFVSELGESLAEMMDLRVDFTLKKFFQKENFVLFVVK